MKRLPLIAAMIASVLVTGCSVFPSGEKTGESAIAAQAAAARKQARNSDIPPDRVTIRDEAGSVVVQKVDFRPGVSSATVERLAKRFGCSGRAGAGLVTDKGPIEVYRMQCDNGTTFMAHCELRQCRPLR